MKKNLIWFPLILVILIGAFYFYIPTTNKLRFQTIVNCTAGGATRQITNTGKWHLWWPGEEKDNNSFTYKNYHYRIDNIRLNGFGATIFNANDSIKAFFQFASIAIDSTQFQWAATYNFSTNPVKRFVQFVQFNKFKSNVKYLLADTKKYFNQQENIYGMKIVNETVKEATYISTKKTFSYYPSTKEIYELIGSLKNYIVRKGGEEKGDPMLHVEQEGPAIYETMVALPTKNELPSEGGFQLKKMILGNILMGEIKGGNYTILTGEKELANYVIDYNKLSPAVGFQSLVTNRLLEADTTKWLTRLYYPIFQ